MNIRGVLLLNKDEFRLYYSGRRLAGCCWLNCKIHSLIVSSLHFDQGALKVLAELILKEDLMELLELAQLDHCFQLGHSRS